MSKLLTKEKERSPKKQRAEEALENLMNLAPPMLKTMLPLFSMQFQAPFDAISDEDIDDLIAKARGWLDYIEFGE